MSPFEITETLVAKRDIDITTPDGACPAALFGEATAPHKAGIILYMDAFGPRPALDEMCQWLSEFGYLVLLPDLFYRSGRYGPFDANTAFKDEKSGGQIRSMMGAVSQAMTQADTGAFIKALTDAGASGHIGTVGYCMGGGRAINAAAAWPDRIKATASFHGGNLANGADDSPAANASKIKAKTYVGVAGVDGSFPPEQSALLAQALREAEVDHTIENYVGSAHGWAVPDHSAFHPAGAERHWKRLTTLFDEALRGA